MAWGDDDWDDEDDDLEGYPQAVVGESHYQPALRDIRDAEGREFTAFLEVEPDNPHDSNAVRVVGPYGGTIGYLPRSAARRSRAIVAKTGRIEVEAKMLGGTREKPTIGVWLDWEPPTRRKKASAAASGGSTPADAGPADNLTLGQGCGCLVVVLVVFVMLASFCG